MQISALKTSSLAGMTKLTRGRTQPATLSLGMSYVPMEVRRSLCGLVQTHGYTPQLSSPPRGENDKKEYGAHEGNPSPDKWLMPHIHSISQLTVQPLVLITFLLSSSPIFSTGPN